MPHRLLILSGDGDQYRELVLKAQLPELEIVTDPVAGVDILMGEPGRIRPVLASLSDLKWVQSIWAGVEPLLDPSLRRDYVLTNARGVFGGLMSEYVIGYLLNHERRIFQRQAAQAQKRWDDTDTGTLRGKTVGLLGVGSIGAEVARTAKFFGMSVRGYTFSSEDCPHVDRYYHGDTLLEFARGLDYLVNILPNTAGTRSIINADVLAALPAHALLINVGRGPAVEEAALVDALTRGRLAGAVLDVFNREPLPAEHPFWTTPGLTMTFHTAAPSLAADISKIFIENYQRYLGGLPLKYQVDFEKGY